MATIAGELGEFVSRFTVDDLPADVIAKAKACLLYGLGIAMAAHDSRQAQIAEALGDTASRRQHDDSKRQADDTGRGGFRQWRPISEPGTERCLWNHGSLRPGGNSRSSGIGGGKRSFRHCNPAGARRRL